jgi:hypothetical protein
MATAPSPNDLTRQQLDELDALLQRMLAIPLNAPDPSAGTTALAPPVPDPVPAPPPRPTPPPPNNWRVDTPPAAATPAPHVLPMQPPENEPPPSLRHPSMKSEPERFAPPPEPAATTLPMPMPAAMPEPELPPMDEPVDTLPYQPSIPVSVQAEPERVPIQADSPFAFPPAMKAATPTPEAASSSISYEVSALPPAPRSKLRVVAWPFIAVNFLIDTSLRMTGFPGRILTSWPVKSLLGLTGLGLIGYTVAYVGQQKGWFALPTPLPWPR